MRYSWKCGVAFTGMIACLNYAVSIIAHAEKDMRVLSAFSEGLVISQIISVFIMSGLDSKPEDSSGPVVSVSPAVPGEPLAVLLLPDSVAIEPQEPHGPQEPLADMASKGTRSKTCCQYLWVHFLPWFITSCCVGSVVEVLIEPDFQNPRGLLSVGLCDLGALLGLFGFLIPRMAPFLSLTDNGLLGIGIVLATNLAHSAQYLWEMVVSFAAGSCAGYFGGVFYKHVIEFKKKKSTGDNRSPRSRLHIAFLWACRGLLMELSRTILFDVFDGYSSKCPTFFVEKLAVNLGSGFICSAPLGEAVELLDHSKYNTLSKEFWGNMAFGLIGNVFFQLLLPILEHKSQELLGLSVPPDKCLSNHMHNATVAL